jgi:nucleobase transporter 1/2
MEGPGSGSIQTGSSVLDQIITVLLSTSMFVSLILGFILDNTIPGQTFNF